MTFRTQFDRFPAFFVLFAGWHPGQSLAQASAPDTGKVEVICTYLRAPPGWDMPSPAVIAFFALVAFLAFCAVGVLVQSSRRNRVLERQVAELMKANARDLSGISNRS